MNHSRVPVSSTPSSFIKLILLLRQNHILGKVFCCIVALTYGFVPLMSAGFLLGQTPLPLQKKSQVDLLWKDVKHESTTHEDSMCLPPTSCCPGGLFGGLHDTGNVCCSGIFIGGKDVRSRVELPAWSTGDLKEELAGMDVEFMSDLFYIHFLVYSRYCIEINCAYSGLY